MHTVTDIQVICVLVCIVVHAACNVIFVAQVAVDFFLFPMLQKIHPNKAAKAEVAAK